MTPFVLLAAIKALPWRLIGYGVAFGAFALLFWRVNVWHDAFRHLEATEKALATITAEAQQCADREGVAALAYAEAARAAETTAAADRITATRIEHELTTKLADADRAGRDLARRLRDHQARRCRVALSAATGSAVELAGTAGEPGDGAMVERATAEHFAACSRDAERLAGWQGWWREVSDNRAAANPSTR